MKQEGRDIGEVYKFMVVIFCNFDVKMWFLVCKLIVSMLKLHSVIYCRRPDRQLTHSCKVLVFKCIRLEGRLTPA